MPAWLLPAIAGGASLISGLFGNKAKNDQTKDQANLYNQWLQNYQNTGQNLMAGAQAQGWNPYGPKTSTSQSQNYSSGGGSFSNRPVITGEYQGIDQLMRNIMTGRLSGGSSLPQGYAQSGIRGINESFEGADQAARNMAARRGLSGEQTYAIASPANRARAGQIADFRANLPLLERQMQNEDIGLASGLQRSFGTGQAGTSSQYSSGSSSGTQTSPFSANDLSALMSIMAPPNPQQTTKSGTSGVATGLDSLGALMGFLASQQGMSPGQPTQMQPNGQMWNLYNNAPGFWT